MIKHFFILGGLIVIGSNLFGQEEFSACETTPILKAFFQGIKDGDTIAVSKLRTVGPILSSDSSYRVNSYKLWVQSIGGFCGAVSYEIQSDLLAPYRGHISRHCLIFFENIIAKNQKGEIVHLAPMGFVVE